MAFLLVGAASAQQPAQDTIRIDVSDDGCTIQVDWSDGREISQKLRVSVDSIFRSDVPIDDVTGVDNSKQLTEFSLAEGDHTIRAFLRGLESTQDETEGPLDDDAVDVECDKPDPTPTPAPTKTPEPTATVKPDPTATTAPPLPTIDLAKAACQFQGRTWIEATRECEPKPVATQPPAAAPTVVVVQAPSGSIRPPSTGDGGLLDTVLPTAWFHDDPAGDSYWRRSHYSFSWLGQVQFYWLF